MADLEAPLVMVPLRLTGIHAMGAEVEGSQESRR